MSKTKLRFVCNTFTGLVYAVVILLLASSASANLYISEWGNFTSPAGNGKIIEFTPSGVPSTFASGLSGPQGIAFNSAGDLFVANGFEAGNGNGNIIEITPGGSQSTFTSGLTSPNGLAFDPSGDLFVAQDGGTIFEYKNNNGTLSSNANLFAYGLNDPQGLVCDSAGDLYVANGNGNGTGPCNIYEYTPGGVQSTFASGLVNPWGLAFNSAGDLLVANCAYSSDGYISSITPGGVQSVFASDVGSPNEIAFNNLGNLFMANGQFSGTGSGDVYQFSPIGSPSTFAAGYVAVVGVAFYPVPEPGSLTLLAFGGISLLIRQRHKKHAS